MAKFITNWPHGRKWGSCSPAMAAQIVAEAPHCAVRLVSEKTRVSRYILVVPEFARTFAQKHPSVAQALRISPLDRYREAQRVAA